MADEKCIICGENAYCAPSDIISGEFYKCNRCGRICFDNTTLLFLKSKDGDKLRACLYYYLKHKNQKNGKPYLIVKEDSDEFDDLSVVTIKELLNIYPKTINDRIDKILENIAEYSPDIGSEIYIDLEGNTLLFSAMFFLNNDNDFAERLLFVLSILEEMNIIQNEESADIIFKIAYGGWERLDKIQSMSMKKQQGFVAMWFNKDLLEYRQAIIEAISETGYIHRIIDEKEYNGQIVPEIFYEIENSDFVIADLTGNRGGVYYEAGYALALGKELIITVKDTEKSENELNDEERGRYIPHFDVAQRNQIRYKDSNDLKEKLVKRITATVGDISRNSFHSI